MISWKEYIKMNILEFRSFYEILSEENKKIVEENESEFPFLLNKPCQVILVDFNEPYPTFIIVLHNAKLPDMETTVLENVVFKSFSYEMLKEVRLLKSLGVKEIKMITNWIESSALEAVEKKLAGKYETFGTSFVILFRKDILSIPFEFSSVVNGIMWTGIHEISRGMQRKKIEETVGDIRRDAEEISRIEVRTKIIEATERLEKQIGQLDKKHEELRDEIVGVRKLVGTETFGEWKVLLSEIDKINTRVGALSDIRSAYDKVLAQQNTFMKQQADVMKQQSSFIKWIKYATILVPIAVVSVPVIEILLRHFLGIS